MPKQTGKHYRSSRDIPAFPTQWLYGLYVLSPVSGVCCHRCLRDTSRKIDATVAAPGPHDFAVRCKRSRPAEELPDAAASIATRATFRDDREASLMAARAERTGASDLPDGTTDLFLRSDLDSSDPIENASESSFLAHAFRSDS